MKHSLLKNTTTILICLFCCSCAVSNTKMASINVNGQIISKSGHAKAGEAVELILPPEYGLKQFDLDYISPEDLEKRQRHGFAKTDSLGTFNYTFKDVTYKTSYWILPPLGNIPGTPDNPKFQIRVLSKPETTYSLSVDEKDITYGVWRSSEDKRRHSKPPYALNGRLIKDTRADSNGKTIKGWITDLILKENY